MNTRLEAHKCGIGVLTREALVSIGSGPNMYRLTAHFCVYDVFKGPGWVLLGTFMQDVFVFGKIMLLPEIYLGEVLL